tara:strand:+ start:8603 stop:9454 length:852 start_codon:yes stop_codon:yes gene_type:complete
MNEKIKIGIVGLGYVGKAIQEFFKNKFEIYSYDIKEDSSCDSLDKVVENSNIIFLCLPTPMNLDGSASTIILEDVISEINTLCSNKELKTIVIKSTVPVGTTENLSLKYNNISLVFNPEFLTEANFMDDFKNQNRIILGGNNLDTVHILYAKTFEKAEIVKTDYRTAEMVKYVINCFLATKVSFANEIESFCSHMNIDYKDMISIACLDKRLGYSHWMVPGNDGKRGFSGSCFPKDISSLINQFDQNKIESVILKACFDRNCNIDRVEKDWEKLIGRAVSEKS